ncbi:MAG: pirin family protein [Sphingomonadaceae bacterium]|nr:pirin family protein [Sphingomonadaceae bacterium]
MITVRPSAARGPTRIGWLDSRHSFSFGDYYDPAHMGFGPLRVINEDRVAAGAGFGAHGHADMEILSYVVSGALAHQDSLGNGETIRPGEIQRMTAGTGVRHAEMNPSTTDPVHFLQIWIEPERRGLAPGYEQVTLPPPAPGALTLLAARERHDGAVVVHQDTALYRATPGDSAPVDIALAAGRRAWLQVVRGAVAANGTALDEGDGAAVTGEAALRLEGDAEVLVFDLP